MNGVILDIWRTRVIDVMKQTLPEFVLDGGSAPGTLRFVRRSGAAEGSLTFQAGDGTFDVFVGTGQLMQPLGMLSGHGEGGYELFPLPAGDSSPADELGRVVFQSLVGRTLDDVSPAGARAAVEPAVQVAVADVQVFALPHLERVSPST